MNNDDGISIEADDLAKHVALRFLGDDPYVRQQFLNDLVPELVFAAPDIILEIASHLRNFSQLFYSVIIPLVVAYLFHLSQKREVKKSQEELETKLREILREHQNQIAEYLARNEELHTRFKSVKLEKHYIRVKPGMKAKWELRLKVYSDRANLLINTNEATKVIIRILNELADEKLN